MLQFDNQWGMTPSWSPDGEQLVVSEFVMTGEALAARLARIRLVAESVTDISGRAELVKDEAPVWSPRGDWIVLGRRFLDKERWTPGRQMWVTRLDASESAELDQTPMHDRFSFAWLPDGNALAYVRSDLSDGPQPVPDLSIWTYELEGNRAEFLVDGGMLPMWWP